MEAVMPDDNLKKYEQHRRADLVHEYVRRWHKLGLVGGTVAVYSGFVVSCE